MTEDGRHLQQLAGGHAQDGSKSPDRSRGSAQGIDLRALDVHLDEIQTVEPKAAVFMVTGGGRVVLDDAYPFVELQWQDGLQLIQLTTNDIRIKPVCCTESEA